MYGSEKDEIKDILRVREIDLLGMSEMRLRRLMDGEDLKDGYVLMYNGVEVVIRNQGVGIIWDQGAALFLQEVRVINEILIEIILKMKIKKCRIWTRRSEEESIHGETEGTDGERWKDGDAIADGRPQRHSG